MTLVSKKSDGRKSRKDNALMTKAKGNPLVATAEYSVYIMKTEKEDNWGCVSVIESGPMQGKKRPGSITHKSWRTSVVIINI
jgi:hypothetical protein